MFNKLITLIYFLSSVFIAQTVQAGIIFYNGHSGYSYSLNTSTNIITSFITPDDNTFSDAANAQWLRWDETEGMSVNDALEQYEDQGWRTPTGTEIVSLLNSFNFGIQWDTDPSTDQTVKKIADEKLKQEVLKFFSLFGVTGNAIDNTKITGTASCSTASNIICKTAAGFVIDRFTGNEVVQVFSMSLDQETGNLEIRLGSDFQDGTKIVTTIFDARPGKGVVLVRDIKPFVGDDLGDDRILQQDQNDFMKIASNDKAYNSLFGGMLAPLSDSRYYLSCHDDTRVQLLISNTLKTTLSASENCWFIPELDNEIVIGFYDDYRPSAEVISNIAKVLGGDQVAMEELTLIVMKSVATLVKNERAVGSNALLPLIGLGSFISNTWPGPGELSKNNYDYHFIANKNVARNYLAGNAGFGHSGLDNIIVSGLGIPRPLIDQVKKDLATTKLFDILFNPKELIETVLLHVIAGEMGTDRVTKAGPTYLYQQRDSDKNGTSDKKPVSCWNSSDRQMHMVAKSYLKEIGEQPLCKIKDATMGDRTGNLISQGLSRGSLGAFPVEFEGPGFFVSTSCSLFGGATGASSAGTAFTTDPGTTITMFSCPVNSEQ